MQGFDARAEVNDATPQDLAPKTDILVLVTDGMEGCHVGFLARHIALHLAEVERFHLQFAKVMELYDDFRNNLCSKLKTD